MTRWFRVSPRTNPLQKLQLLRCVDQVINMRWCQIIERSQAKLSPISTAQAGSATTNSKWTRAIKPYNAWFCVWLWKGSGQRKDGVFDLFNCIQFLSNAVTIISHNHRMSTSYHSDLPTYFHLEINIFLSFLFFLFFLETSEKFYFYQQWSHLSSMLNLSRVRYISCYSSRLW